MKKLMFAGAIALSSSVAFANDGGIVGIKVQDMKVEKTAYVSDQDKTERTPVELKDNEQIVASFKGNTAVRELMKYLPGVRSVVKGTGQHIRSLAIAAKEGYVSITCEDAEVSFNQKGKESWNAKEPSCTVSISKYQTPVTDENVTDLFGDWQDFAVPRACKIK